MSTLIPHSRLGSFPYQVVKVLDENPGNMSEVYLASAPSADAGEDSLVVLKIALGQQEGQANTYQETLENEVQRLRRLKHPGVVRIFPIQREGIRNLPYIAQATALAGTPSFSVMEYLTGGSLTTLIEQKRLDIGMALEIARSIAATLDYLHSRKQVHLDLKPDNVLFRVPPMPGEPVEPVLIDFGIARDIGQGGLKAHTLQYASPERVQPARHPEQPPERIAPPHPAMDVYALGVVLYEMLTGHLPFQGRTKKSLTSSILNDLPKPPSSYESRINADLDELVLKLLAKDARDRSTAEEAAVRLEEIAIRGGYLPRYPNRSGEPRRLPPVQGKKSGPLQIVAVLLIILVLAELFFILGTYPFWRNNLGLNSESFGKLWENARQVTLQHTIIPIMQWIGIGNVSSAIGIDMAAQLARTLTPTPTSEFKDKVELALSPPTVVLSTTPPALVMSTNRDVVTVRAVTISTTTSLPTHTATSVPLAASTPTPTRTATQAPTASLSPSTSTSLPTATLLVTSTPLSTATPSPTPTLTPTFTPLPTLTPAPTLASFTANAAVPDNGAGNRSARLITPLDGDSVAGDQEFRWSADFDPPAGAAFEVIFWQAGQNPLKDGWGMAAPTLASTVHVNLSRLDDNPKIPLEPGEYLWGVLLVRQTPYKRLQYLGSSHRFRFQR